MMKPDDKDRKNAIPDAAEIAMIHKQRKGLFVHALAKFLVKDQGRKSIQLQMNSPMTGDWAKEWCELRQATPLFGYPTETEAEEVLTRFLD